MQILSGSILREERKRRNLSQKQLAAELEVSPTYVNLMENGHRPIPPQLRSAICVILNIDEALLMGEHNRVQIERLKNSRHLDEISDAELERLVVEMPHIVENFIQLEEELDQSKYQIQRLTHRLGKDEDLSNNIHGLLSIATSIRSTSSILNTQGDLAAEHSARFRELLHSDARQLSDNLRELVNHLNRESQNDAQKMQAELNFMRQLDDQQYAFDELETGAVTADGLPQWLGERFGQEIANKGTILRLFTLFLTDIQNLPRDQFLPIAQKLSWDCEQIGDALGVGYDRILRRKALLSSQINGASFALFVQDQTGLFWFESTQLSGRRNAELSCPFWPIFQCDEFRGGLISRQLTFLNGATYHADAASGVYRFAPSRKQNWSLKTMLVERIDESNSSGENLAIQKAGLACQDCRVLDCASRQNQALSLLNKNNTQQN